MFGWGEGKDCGLGIDLFSVGNQETCGVMILAGASLTQLIHSNNT